MGKKWEVTLLRNCPHLTKQAAGWFRGKWGVPASAYEESISLCQKNKIGVPQWYVVLDGDKMAAGLGVIENDFHKQKELTPNICSVFVEKEYRGLGLARLLLDFACADIANMDISDIYLCTDHVGFYEKCGWDFLCMGEDNEGNAVRMYHRKT